MALLLNGDGLIVNLYHLLWVKDMAYSEKSFVLLPDTVIYRYEQPSFWYFSSASGGVIKRKSKKNITAQKIFEAFTKSAGEREVVATFMYGADGEHRSSCEELELDADRVGRHLSVFEYFDKKRLREFLWERGSRPSEGVLQRFVYPKNENNTVIRMTWSPSLCLFEEKINRQNIADQRLDVYERVATYEGAEHLCRNVGLHADLLTHKLQTIGNCMRQHIINVTFERTKISRMVLHFKLDRRGRLWFMWCSSIRSEPNNKKHPYVRITDLGPMRNIPISLQANAKVPSSGVSRPPPAAAVISRRKSQLALDNIVSCQLCLHKAEADRMYEVSYRVLLKFEEGKLSQKEGQADPLLPFLGSSSSASASPTPSPSSPPTSPAPYYRSGDVIAMEPQRKVPAIFSRLHPELREADFASALKDVVFLSQTTEVCEECYLSITQPYINPPPDLAKPKHTAALTSPKIAPLLAKLPRPSSQEFIMRPNAQFVKRVGSVPALLSPAGLQQGETPIEEEAQEPRPGSEQEVARKHQLELLKMSTGAFSDQNVSQNIFFASSKKSFKNITTASTSAGGRLFTPTCSSMSRAFAVAERSRELEERRLQAQLMTNSAFWKTPLHPYTAKPGKRQPTASDLGRTGFSSLHTNDLVAERPLSPGRSMPRSPVEMSLEALAEEGQASKIKSELQEIKLRHKKEKRASTRTSFYKRNASVDAPRSALASPYLPRRIPPRPPRKMPEIEGNYEIEEKPEQSTDRNQQQPQQQRGLSSEDLTVLAESSKPGPPLNQDLRCVQL